MRETKKISLIISLIVALIAGGCNKRPDGVLSDSEMEDLLTDLILADAYGQSASANSLPDSIRNRLGEAVLKKHGVDRATLDSTYSWYARNLDDYYELYSRVDRRLTKLRNKTGGSGIREIENDIWPLPKNLMLSPNAYGCSMTFRMPGEMMAGGEQLHWKMKVNGTSAVDVLLGIDYDNGTSAISRREFQGGNVDLTVVADTANKVKRIFGFIMANRRDMPIWADSISLAKNSFDSVAYLSIRSQRLINPPAKIIRKQGESDTIADPYFTAGRRVEQAEAVFVNEPSGKIDKNRKIKRPGMGSLAQ